MERSSRYILHWLLFKGLTYLIIIFMLYGIIKALYFDETFWLVVNTAGFTLFLDKHMKDEVSGKFEEIEEMQIRYDRYRRESNDDY